MSIRSDAKRPRSKWCPSVQKYGEQFEFTLKYLNSRGVLSPYSSCAQNVQVKTPWGPPDSCIADVSQNKGTAENFLRFTRRGENVMFFLSSLNSMAESVNALSQKVQALVTAEKYQLLANFFSLLNRSQNFCKYHPEIFTDEGFRKDGLGIQEVDLQANGGSVEMLKIFLRAAVESALVCGTEKGQTTLDKMLKRKVTVKSTKISKPNAETRQTSEISEEDGIEQKYSKSFIGNIDVNVNMLEVDPSLKCRIGVFHVEGIKKDPSLLSIVVRPKDLTSFNPEKPELSNYLVVQGIHSFTALQKLEVEGKLRSLPTLKEGLVTVSIINLEDEELVLYGNVRGNCLASKFVRKPKPQVQIKILIYSYFTIIKLHGLY